MNMDNGKTLGFHEDKNVEYRDVVSNDEGMMVWFISRYVSHLKILMIIFNNSKRSYSIQRLQDNIFGICY